MSAAVPLSLPPNTHTQQVQPGVLSHLQDRVIQHLWRAQVRVCVWGGGQQQQQQQRSMKENIGGTSSTLSSLLAALEPRSQNSMPLSVPCCRTHKEHSCCLPSAGAAQQLLKALTCFFALPLVVSVPAPVSAPACPCLYPHPCPLSLPLPLSLPPHHTPVPQVCICCCSPAAAAGCPHTG